MEASAASFWRKCNTCKKPIAFGSPYYVCSVSTCNGLRTGYVFCSVMCVEAHIPGANHRSAAAVEKRAPNQGASTHGASSASDTPKRFIAKTNPTTTGSLQSPSTGEVLIIASRLKEYISAKSDFNTSQGVMDVLSNYVRILCNRAIENARADGRKTVLDRDFDFLKHL